MAELVVPQIDFSTLGNLGKTYTDARNQAQSRQTLADLGSRLQGGGNIDYTQAAGQALAGGNQALGLSLLTLGNSNADKAFNRDYKNRYLDILSQRGAAANNGVYGTPIYGKDPKTGQTMVGAIGKDGTLHWLDASGQSVTPGIKVIDTGTGSLIVNSRTGAPVGGGVPQAATVPTGQPSAPTSAAPAPQFGQPPVQSGAFIPKDVAGESQQKAYGQGRGKLEVAKPQATYALGNALSGLDRMKDAATGLLNDPSIGNATGNVVGQFGAIPFYNTDDVRKIENLKTQIGFAVLQAMRDASKTGGALGQVSEAEHKYLQNAIASLERSQSTPQFKTSLQTIIDYVDGAKGRLNQSYQQTYGSQDGAGASPQVAPAQGDPLSAARAAIARGANRGAVIQRLQQHGINPAGL